MDATYLDLTIRLSMALALGGAIGIEREYRAKEAGFRTHFLVALGSALFCIVSQYGFGFDLKDSSRVAAQVVSGIGFLGAGTIIFQKNVVRGLTTAAGLWVTAAIGLACGTGMYVAALATTVMVLLGLEVLNYLIPQFFTTNIELSFFHLWQLTEPFIVGLCRCTWNSCCNFLIIGLYSVKGFIVSG